MKREISTYVDVGREMRGRYSGVESVSHVQVAGVDVTEIGA